jgi:hypothetical protein
MAERPAIAIAGGNHLVDFDGFERDHGASPKVAVAKSAPEGGLTARPAE